MTALVVVAHPDPESLTHHVASTIRCALQDGGVATQVADLHAEGFDPRYSSADRRRYLDDGPLPRDVRAEHDRLDGIDDLVLVFPVYWWSMPALLKGWIDRVFIRGWAFDDRVVPTRRLLGHMRVHLVMLAGDDADGYARRGYDTAMATQIETGVLGYCGARTGAMAIIHDSEGAVDVEAQATGIAESIARSARAAGADLAVS